MNTLEYIVNCANFPDEEFVMSQKQARYIVKLLGLEHKLHKGKIRSRWDDLGNIYYYREPLKNRRHEQKS